jgi:hypothetical protein
MRKNFFNYLVGNDLKTLMVIAIFNAFGTVPTPLAASTTLETGLISHPVASVTAPIWAKLVLSGNTVTCSYAFGVARPTVWQQFGVPRTINFINNPILIGIYVTSHNTAALSSGTLDNFSITPAASYQLADYDVGAPVLMGSSNLISGVWHLSGSGAGVRSTSDQCNFQSWLVTADCTVICRVTSLSGGNPDQNIGIMLRDGFNSGSDYALFCAELGGIDFQYRTSFNDNPDKTVFVVPPLPGVQSSVAIGYGLTGGTIYTLRP